MLVIVNAQSGGGRGEARWRAVEAALPADAGRRVRLCRDLADARAVWAEAEATRAPFVVAAGGDGSVNFALNAIMDPATDRPRWETVLGAVGLGSSNDWHKPRRPGDALAGRPAALDWQRALRVDVGRVDWLAGDGTRGLAYFMLNASLGATAQGNARYNRPGGLLALLKRTAGPDAAIALATVEGLATWEPVPATIALDGAAPYATRIANLGVIKRPWFAGGMRYDTPVEPDDGRFDVNLAEHMSRLEFMAAAAQIAQGRFLAIGSPKLKHWRAAEVRIVVEAPSALEYDGEVTSVREATLRVVPRAIRVAVPAEGERR